MGVNIRQDKTEITEFIARAPISEKIGSLFHDRQNELCQRDDLMNQFEASVQQQISLILFEKVNLKCEFDAFNHIISALLRNHQRNV